MRLAKGDKIDSAPTDPIELESKNKVRLERFRRLAKGYNNI